MNPIEAFGIGLNYTGTVLNDQIFPKCSPAAQGTPDAA